MRVIIECQFRTAGSRTLGTDTGDRSVKIPSHISSTWCLYKPQTINRLLLGNKMLQKMAFQGIYKHGKIYLKIDFFCEIKTGNRLIIFLLYLYFRGKCVPYFSLLEFPCFHIPSFVRIPTKNHIQIWAEWVILTGASKIMNFRLVLTWKKQLFVNLRLKRDMLHIIPCFSILFKIRQEIRINHNF